MGFTKYRTPFLEPYLRFTAYSVTSTSWAKGNYVRHTQSPVPLDDAYIVSVGPLNGWTLSGSNYVTKDASAITAEYSAFLDDKYTSLYTFIGYEACTAALPPSPVVPVLATELSVASENTSPAPATVSSTVTPAESSRSAAHPHTTQIIIVSVVVPTVVLILILLCLFGIRRHQKKRSQLVPISQTNTTSDTQLYVDRKAELEDEERRKYELDATGRMYKMEGEDRIFEMSSGGDAEMRSASFLETHELRSDEHSQELETPGDAF